MDELIAFLNARLDEDEQTAKAANPAPWRRFTDKEHLSPDAIFGGRWPGDEDRLRNVASVEYSWKRDENAAHIVRHDPARVLADVAAKRAIIDDLTSYGEKRGDDEAAEWHREGHNYARFKVLRLLALPYADHPDYREEWRP